MRLTVSALRAGLLSQLRRGDELMLKRLARLLEPGGHGAAILIADLESSPRLARELPSPAYFEVLQAMTTTIDRLVVAGGGIVGKHTSHGVTAFFVADDLGSPSRAARAAVSAARAVVGEAGTVVEESLARRRQHKGGPWRGGTVNVGLHWGGALYIGQLVTRGRVEVTVLGDEVKECERIQRAAHEGQVLASQSLLEQLERRDAARLRLARPSYLTLDELTGTPQGSGSAAGLLVTIV